MTQAVYHGLKATNQHTKNTYNCFVSDNFAKRLRLLTDLSTKHPDLRDAYLSKSQIAAYKFDIISDEEQMKTQIADIDPVFADIEEQLAKIKKGTSSSLIDCKFSN